MDSATVNSFIIGCIVLLVGLTGFLGKNWFTDQKKTSEKLANAIDRLTEFIDRVEKVQDLHGFKIGQIEKEIAAMATTARMFGRRAIDRCDRDDCPFEETRPGTGTGEVSLTGSGAKILADLIDKAKKAGPHGGD